MRLYVFTTLIILSSCTDILCQSIRTEPLPRDEYIGSNAWQSRAITRRGTSVNQIISGRREIDSKLLVQKQANQSMRSSREALARRRFIRKEKSKIVDKSCQKTYNAYVQNDCVAYSDLENPTQSFELYRNELVVLQKQKKDYYELCIIGETFFVFRESEKTR